MKKVLAELHELINEFEDQGLTAEASSLQEVFVRVAQEANTEDDLSNDVENILKSHSIAEVLAEIAKHMDGGDKTQTSSFAFGDEPGGYGNEPKEKIIDEFVTQVKRKENTPHDAYKMMNDRLQFNGHGTMGYNEFLDKVSPSVAKVSEFAFGDEPDSGAEAPGVDEETERQNIISSWRKHVEKGNMSRSSAARMATQQLRMKFPNAELITETEIAPLKSFPDNGKPFGGVFELGHKELPWNTGRRY
jgi:hypothetical protein